MAFQRVGIQVMVLLVLILVGHVRVRSGMGFSRLRRLRGLGSGGGGLGIKGGSDGGDLRSLAAEVIGEEEEGENAADDGGKQWD